MPRISTVVPVKGTPSFERSLVDRASRPTSHTLGQQLSNFTITGDPDSIATPRTNDLSTISGT